MGLESLHYLTPRRLLSFHLVAKVQIQAIIITMTKVDKEKAMTISQQISADVFGGIIFNAVKMTQAHKLSDAL